MLLREVREKQGKLVADARAKLEEITSDTPESRAAEINVEYDAIMAEYDRLEVRAKKLEVLAALEAEQNRADPRRPNGENVNDGGETRGGGGAQPSTEQLHRSAFAAFLRSGRSGLTPEQRAVLRTDAEQRFNPQATTAGADGGYLVPTGFMAELIVALKAWGPMMDPGIVRYMSTATGNQIPWPTMDDTSNMGAMINENTQVSLTEVTFGTKVLSAYKATSGLVLVASELLQDAALDIETIVRMAMAERMARLGNAQFTTGAGGTGPMGIATAVLAGPNVKAAAAAAAITFDDMINTFHTLDPAYRNDPSVRWQFHDLTLKALRQLKDGYGRYIWQPANVATAQPETILDKPYAINQNMAQIGDSALSVIFGAHNRYIWRNVNEFSIRRLVERYADYDQTGFIGFTRFDGQLLDQKAFAGLQHPAS